MQRSEDRCDKRRFRGFNHSKRKTVLNLLEAVYLRFRRIVVERVAVIKFIVDNRGSYGTGCFRIELRTDSAEHFDQAVLMKTMGSENPQTERCSHTGVQQCRNMSSHWQVIHTDSSAKNFYAANALNRSVMVVIRLRYDVDLGSKTQFQPPT